MALLPAGEAGKLLQWYDTGGGVYALRNRSMDDLIDEIASTGPTANKYYLDVSNVATEASAPAVSGTGSIASVSVSCQCQTSAAAVSGTGSIATVNASSGAGVTVGAAAVSGTGELATVTVTTGGGTKLSRTDNFNRTNGALGSNWTTLTAATAHAIVSNQAKSGSANAADYWGADTFTGNHYSEVAVSSANCGPAVRMQAAAQSGYRAYIAYDMNADDGTYSVEVDKVVGGTVTELRSYGTTSDGIVVGATLRLEANSTGLVLKVNGATLWTRGSETSLSGGAPGVWSLLSNDIMDNWAGGDL